MMNYVSRHFSLTETECRCGCGLDLSDSYKQFADELREAYCAVTGRSGLTMTSGARCASYNQKVSTTGPQGPHTTGNAADYGVSGADAYALLKLAFERPLFRGIGINQKGSGRFIHLDTLPRPERIVWSY